MISLRVGLSITFMIVVFTSFSNVLSSNYVLANNFTLSKQDNENNAVQNNISYYSLFSDLSRNFTSTISKFKTTNDSEGVSATASAGPGGTSASAGGITVNSP
jgi:hypothetical protein